MYNRRREYFLPFVFIVTALFLVVVSFKIVAYLFFSDGKETKLFVVTNLEGQVLVREWGEEFFIPLLVHAKLRHGDVLRTQDGRAEIIFAKDFRVRMDKKGELSISDFSNIMTREAPSYVDLLQGVLWIDADTEFSSARVEQNNFSIALSEASVFQVGYVNDTFQLDVFEGNVLVQYFTGINPLFTFSLPAGGGVTFNIQGINDIILGKRDYEEFLRPLDSSLAGSEWVSWNRSFTPQSPTSYKPDVFEENGLAILYPENGSEVSDDSVEIKGVTPSSTHYIVVYVGEDDQEGYRLRKYVPNSRQWRYVASEELENLHLGKNIYRFVAFDKEEKKISEEKLEIRKE